VHNHFCSLELHTVPLSRTWPRSNQVGQQSPSHCSYRARAHTAILLPRALQQVPDMHIAVHCCMHSWRRRQSWCGYSSLVTLEVTLEAKPAWLPQSHTFTATRLPSLASALSSERAEAPLDTRGCLGSQGCHAPSVDRQRWVAGVMMTGMTCTHTCGMP
jgi:hypothetical protein